MRERDAERCSFNSEDDDDKDTGYTDLMVSIMMMRNIQKKDNVDDGDKDVNENRQKDTERYVRRYSFNH